MAYLTVSGGIPANPIVDSPVLLPTRRGRVFDVIKRGGGSSTLSNGRYDIKYVTELRTPWLFYALTRQNMCVGEGINNLMCPVTGSNVHRDSESLIPFIHTLIKNPRAIIRTAFIAIDS
jgi:hypothetical protein